MWRNIASNALTFFLVLAFVLSGLVIWGQGAFKAEGPLETAVCLRVDPGSSFSAVQANLTKYEAVSDIRIFRLGLAYSGKKNQLKAGSFLLPAGTSMEEIIDIVTRGGANTCGTEVVYRIGIAKWQFELREMDPETRKLEVVSKYTAEDTAVPSDLAETMAAQDTRHRIIMAEGVTSWQVNDVLSRISALTGDVEGVPSEGSLAPDSYEFVTGTSRAAILAAMQKRQSEILAEAWENRVADLPLKTPEEALVLASIVEKETGVPSERRQVASVFVNRLNKQMRLQTDPTVIYGITKGEGTLGRGLRQSELARPTPYNTYVIPALPPTPIANPGRAAIEAALNPDQTEYIYFVADGTGGHAFAKTLAEHNANVANWRKIEKERKANE